MDIVQLLAPGPFGGLERVVTLLAIGLARRGHRVLAALLVEAEQQEQPELVAALQQAGVEVVLIRAPHRAYHRERELVRRFLKSQRPAVVHSHGYHVDVLLRSVAQRLGIPVVATVHGFTTGGIKNRIFEWLERRSLRRMDLTVAVSDPLARLLIESGVPADRVQVVRNAYAAPGQFLSRNQARGRLGLGPRDPVIGWVGRVSPEKGPDVMLDGLLCMATPGVKLCIIGRGRMLVAMEQRVQRLGMAGRVLWRGSMPDAWQLFPAFDVYCLSSRTEGTPMALFEAMAAGVPVVTTRVGGIPDVVSEQEAWLVPPDEPAALAAALDQALGDPAERARRVAAAGKRLASDFALEPWLERYETIYRSVTNRGRSSA
jgi:glycosyltransferase involved in cell wall biosynthesis